MSWWTRLRRAQSEGAVALAPVEDVSAPETTDYLFGESEAEISRLDLQHFLFRWEFGSDYSAPVNYPATVLDIACGTGRWARDMARRFPQAAVVGFDLNHEQIERSLAEGTARGNDLLPENCTFLVGDALQPFGFGAGTFDLVMARATSAFIPVSRWPAVVREMARVARRGGWVEVRDFGLVHSDSPALDKLTLTFAQLAANRGIHPGSGPFLEGYLREAGLEGVNIRRAVACAGAQASRGGRLMLIDYLTLLGWVTPLIGSAGLMATASWMQLLQAARYETATAATEVVLTAAYGQRI